MTTICPICKQQIPVKRYQEGDKVYDEKTCPIHGTFTTLVWNGQPSFSDWNLPIEGTRPFQANTQIDEGCPYDCGLCEQHQQAACCVLIELTDRCNQHCPYCFASVGDSMKPEPTLEDIHGIYSFLLEQSPDRPFNIQLSGGEPTLREDLADIIRLGKLMGFPYIQVNTNGKRLAEHPAYAVSLKKAGLSSVFLQFDGLRDEIYQETRGENLLSIKKEAIANCAAADLGVVLVVTVVPLANLEEVGAIIRYAIQNRPHIRGIHFQPVSYFGRFPKEPSDEDRVTIPELIAAIEAQTDGMIHRDSFVPLASGHPLCSFHGNYLVKDDGDLVPLSKRTASSETREVSGNPASIVQARDYISRKWSWESPEQPGTDETSMEFAEWDQMIQEMRYNSFSITAMAFMDQWNLDLERLKRCRVQVATVDRTLMPFCSYNILHRK